MNNLQEGGIVTKECLYLLTQDTTREILYNSFEDIKAMEKLLKDKKYYFPFGKIILTESMKKRLGLTRKSKNKD